ncbi:hypothetical protein Pmani_032269 [Petrolisthes manimaculis]|uniref:Uncharacterized protein n=1 Tax=Petrolisthes manimaculis TaxID=1843537 RepID=A0AAE1NTE6_9EUCA|nr:hypothetical protein Pmani_032269 [Petrolisthes manimaculis]
MYEGRGEREGSHLVGSSTEVLSEFTSGLDTVTLIIPVSWCPSTTNPLPIPTPHTHSPYPLPIPKDQVSGCGVVQQVNYSAGEAGPVRVLPTLPPLLIYPHFHHFTHTATTFTHTDTTSLLIYPHCHHFSSAYTATTSLLICPHCHHFTSHLPTLPPLLFLATHTATTTTRPDQLLDLVGVVTV